MKYRKKPIEVEAIQWDGEGDTANKIFEFASQSLLVCENGKAKDNFRRYDFSIKTLEGTMRVSPYDYIIKGVNGEFYPCKPDIFEQTYEEVKPFDPRKTPVGSRIAAGFYD